MEAKQAPLTFDPSGIEIPEGALSIHNFLSTIKTPVRNAFKGMTYTIFGDVDRISPWQGNAYITLMEKVGKYSITLKVFLPQPVLRNSGIDLKPKMKLLVTGNVTLNRNEIEIRAITVEDIGFGRLHKQIKEWQTKYQSVFDRQKRPIPLLCSKIALISSHNILGYGDFTRHLKYGAVELYERKMQGDAVGIGIASAIEDVNNRHDIDLIAIVRGGGSFLDLYEFSTPIVIESISGSVVPVATAIGHEGDITLADLAADVRYSTPTDCAKDLTRRTELLIKGISEKSTMICHSALNVASRSEHTVRSHASEVVSSAREQAHVAEKRTVTLRNIIIDTARSAAASYAATIDKIKEVLKGALSQAEEREALRKRHRKIIAVAGIIIAILTATVILLLLRN